jgi:hypothetical protein
MASRILLVNFQEADADRLKKLGFEVDRGHYSNAVEFQKTGTLSTEKIYSFLPDSIEKYRIIVVNLNYNTAVETEFRQKRQILDKSFRTYFNKYWNDVGILIVFYGDYNYDGCKIRRLYPREYAIELRSQRRYAFPEGPDRDQEPVLAWSESNCHQRERHQWAKLGDSASIRGLEE